MRRLPRYRCFPPFGRRRAPLVLAALALLAALVSGCASASSGRRAPGGAQTQSAAPTGRTYVAIGASDAFGVGTNDPDRESWPSDVARALGADTHLINLGIPGATLADARKNEEPIALDSNPDIVTIWLGVNDIQANVSLDSYSADLRALLAALRQRTHARVYVGNLPDLTLLPYFAGRDPAALHAQLAHWNAAIAAACAANGATVVDLASRWNDLASHPEYIASDGLHPSTVGAQRLADLFVQAIEAKS